ncbi:MAG: hypothetical protein AAF720_05940 [Pseudomonadota bacterium]
MNASDVLSLNVKAATFSFGSLGTFVLTLCLFAMLALFGQSQTGRRFFLAPALTIAVGLCCALTWRLVSGPVPPPDLSANLAAAGLSVLGFASATQVRVSRFAKRRPTSFRLSVIAGPIYFLACVAVGIITLPQISVTAALLLGAALMLNGSAFDRRLVLATAAPKSVKSVVHSESAASLVIGLPIAVLVTGYATPATLNEHALAPLLLATISLLKGFALGGAAGLIAAKYFIRADKPWLPAVIAAFACFTIAPILGAQPVIAVTAVGLLWGEQSSCDDRIRRLIRRKAERLVSPAAYFGFGAILGPRFYEADLLSIFYAIAAASILRALPRAAVLKSTTFPKASQTFLAWYGGAPGAASALFLMMLAGNAAIVDADGVLTLGALCVIAGVIAARSTAKPLLDIFLRQTALARRGIRPA